MGGAFLEGMRPRYKLAYQLEEKLACRLEADASRPDRHRRTPAPVTREVWYPPTPADASASTREHLTPAPVTPQFRSQQIPASAVASPGHLARNVLLRLFFNSTIPHPR